MKRFAFLGASLLCLSACDPLQQFARLQTVETAIVTCPQATGCTFNLVPLRVLPEPVTLPRRSYTFFPTADELRFVDPRGRVWIAPRRTLTDGASIPPVFVSIVGNPTAPSFINAAAVHDAYCGVGNEEGVRFHDGRWEDVHKMFYDALVAGGTEPGTAKLMFAAVWLGGPRWNTLRGLSHVPAGRMQQAMRETQAFLEREEPDFAALQRYLWWKQRVLLDEYPAVPNDEPERHSRPDEKRDDDAGNSGDGTAGGGTKNDGSTGDGRTGTGSTGAGTADDLAVAL